MTLVKQSANIRQGRDGWHGENLVELNGITWKVSTLKNYQGVILCNAYQVEVERSNGFLITSFSPFSTKSLRLAEETGKATQNKILQLQQAGLNRLYMLHEAGELPKAAEPLKVGQLIFLHGYEGGRAVIYQIEGKTVHMVDLDKKQFIERNSRDIKPATEIYGIGWYYRDGEIMDLEELNNLVNEVRLITEERATAERIAKEERKLIEERELMEGAKLLPAIPAGAVAILIAELEENTSDPMTDYYGSRTVDRVYLAWSGHNRDLFTEMRKAAGRFEGTKHLETAGEDAEHREKYSMGAGYYLSTTGRYSGWQIKKRVLQTKPDGYGITLKELQKAAAQGKLYAGQTIDTAPKEEQGQPVEFNGGAVIKLNTAKGGIEIYFERKPDFSVLQDLKANGFRWAKWSACWYKLDSPAARRIASKYGTIPGTEPDQAGAYVQANENEGLDKIARDIAA